MGALIFLAWMILKFGDRPARLFAEPTMPVFFIGPRADGVAEGSPVLYQGVNVGRVTAVKRADNGKDVMIDAQLDLKPPLPANVEGRIVAQSLLGAGAGINLFLTGPEPEGQLAPKATLPAKYIGLALLPPEFESLAAELRATTIQFRDSKIIEHLDQQVQKAGEVMDSVKSLVNDKEMRADLRQSLANVREAT